MKHKNSYNLLGKIPVFGKFFWDFDKIAGEKGIHNAVAALVKKTKTKIIVHGLTKETVEILKSKPVILAANHPYDIELIPLIAALPKRDNIFVIAASDLMGMGQNTSSYLIPVFNHKYFDKGAHKLSVIVAKLFHLGPRFSPLIEHKKNIENLADAVSKIKENGLVAIFPEGILKTGSPWFLGIGYLLSSLYKKSNGFYARAYIQGTSAFDIFRLIPIIGRYFPPLNVYFDLPRELSIVLKNNDDPRKITKNLQDEYNEWIDTF